MILKSLNFNMLQQIQEDISLPLLSYLFFRHNVSHKFAVAVICSVSRIVFITALIMRLIEFAFKPSAKPLSSPHGLASFTAAVAAVFVAVYKPCAATQRQCVSSFHYVFAFLQNGQRLSSNGGAERVCLL